MLYCPDMDIYLIHTTQALSDLVRSVASGSTAKANAVCVQYSAMHPLLSERGRQWEEKDELTWDALQHHCTIYTASFSFLKKKTVYEEG